MSLKDIVASSQALEHFAEKKKGGKYVREAELFGSKLTFKQREWLYEQCKRIPITRKMPEDLVVSIANWTAKYVGKKPSVRLIESLNQMTGIAAEGGMEVGKKISWGAFVQAFQEEIKGLAGSNMFMFPRGQSFHYSRAMYMVLTRDQCKNYMQFRNGCCYVVFLLMKTAYPGIENAKTMVDVSDMIQKNLSAFPFKDLPADTDDKIPDDLRTPGNSTHALAAAYWVDYRMYLQNSTLRQEGSRMTELDAQFIRAHVDNVYKQFGKTVSGTFDMVKKGNPIREEYFNLAKSIKNIVVVSRAIARSGTNAFKGGQPVTKNPEKWTIVF